MAQAIMRSIGRRHRLNFGKRHVVRPRGRSHKLQSPSRMTVRDIKSIAAWLVDGAHCMHGPELIMQELCDRVAATGIPISRAEAIIRTLHPQVMGRCFLWLPGPAH